MIIERGTGYNGLNAKSDVDKKVSLNLYLNMLINVMGRIH
jgi:hypothetical protein